MELIKCKPRWFIKSKLVSYTQFICSSHMLFYTHRYQSTYYQMDFTNTWRRVTLPISNPDVYGTAVRLRWRQGGNAVGEWAIDNIVIGNRMLHCPQICNSHGRCTLNSVCICDEGYSGDQCEQVNIPLPTFVQVRMSK